MTNPYQFPGFGYDLFESIQSLAAEHEMSVPEAISQTLRVCTDLLQHGDFIKQLQADLRVEVRNELISELQKNHGRS